MQDLIVAVLALLGGCFSAWLSDRFISTKERDLSLFAPICCAACGRSREIWDRVPLLSWLLNGGKCRFCGAVLAKREPLISFCTITVWMIGMQYGKAYMLVFAASESALLCAAGLCWICTSERPVLFPLLLCTGVFGVILPDGISLNTHLFGAGGMLAFGLLLRYLPESIRGHDRIRGDTVVYLGFVGLMQGWRNSFAILPTAVIIGALFMLLRGKKEVSSTEGKNGGTFYADPVRGRLSISLCLTCAAVLTMLVGRPMMNWYLSLFSQIG